MATVSDIPILTCSPEHSQSTHTGCSPPTTDFHLFPNLPAELRLKIWDHAIPSRIVTLRYSASTHSITSPTSPPALLHVCRESRYEALRFYNLSFSTSTSESTIYFSPMVDSIYKPRYRSMGYDETLRDFKGFLKYPEEFANVKELALDYVDTREKRPWEAYDKAVLIRSFPNLERLLLVLGKKCDKKERSREVVFEEAAIKVGAQKVSVIEAEFSEAWSQEARIARDVRTMEGKEVEEWVLPALSVVQKRDENVFLKVL